MVSIGFNDVTFVFLPCSTTRSPPNDRMSRQNEITMSPVLGRLSPASRNLKRDKPVRRNYQHFLTIMPAMTDPHGIRRVAGGVKAGSDGLPQKKRPGMKARPRVTNNNRISRRLAMAGMAVAGGVRQTHGTGINTRQSRRVKTAVPPSGLRPNEKEYIYCSLGYLSYPIYRRGGCSASLHPKPPRTAPLRTKYNATH